MVSSTLLNVLAQNVKCEITTGVVYFVIINIVECDGSKCEITIGVVYLVIVINVVIVNIVECGGLMA